MYTHILGKAVATVAILITETCGAEVATTPAQLNDPVEQEQSQPGSDGGESLVDLPQRGSGAEGWR